MFLTTAELADRWKTTPGGIAQLRQRGTCPSATRIGRRLLYALADIEAWEAAHREVAS